MSEQYTFFFLKVALKILNFLKKNCQESMG